MKKCKYCDSVNVREIYSSGFRSNKNRFKLCECENCKIVTTCPEPNHEDLSRAYDTEYYGEQSSKFNSLVEKWTLYAATRRVAWLLKQHGKKDKRPLRVLDVGCGRGVLSSPFEQRGHIWHGIERNGSPFEGGNNITCGQLSEIDIEPESFDIIIVWHVLEHLVSPEQDLKILRGLLKQDGSIFISVPNIDSLQAKLFQGRWFHLDLPRHIVHFGGFSLDFVMQNAKFSTETTSTLCLDQQIFGFLQSTLNYFPLIEDNHLYSLLKAGESKINIIKISLYIPVIIPILLIATVEMLFSVLQGKGACLIVKARRDND